MPTNWDAAQFASAYQVKINWADPNDPANLNGERIGEVIGYGKDFARYFMRGTRQFEHYRRRSDFVISRLTAAGLNATHRGFVIGNGFGYLTTAMRAAGYPLWWGIDSSQHISNNFATESVGVDDTVFDDILDINKTRLKNKITSLTGDWQFHVIITENVLESYLPGEEAALLQIAQACETALIGTDYRRIIHIVNDTGQKHWDAETGAFRQNWDETFPVRWLSLDGWSALRPTHTFVSAHTGRVIVGSG